MLFAIDFLKVANERLIRGGSKELYNEKAKPSCPVHKGRGFFNRLNYCQENDNCQRLLRSYLLRRGLGHAPNVRLMAVLALHVHGEVRLVLADLRNSRMTPQAVLNPGFYLARLIKKLRGYSLQSLQFYTASVQKRPE